MAGITTTSTSADSGSNTYKVGENTQIWTITESKSKSLKLSSDTGGSSSHTSTSGGSSTTTTSTTTGSAEMTLEQK